MSGKVLKDALADNTFLLLSPAIHPTIKGE